MPVPEITCAEALDRYAVGKKIPTSFDGLFKRATGIPPSQYQIKLRMDAARRLLRETKKNVIMIALEVGCSNPSHFALLFAREAVFPPTDYRRQR